MIIEVEKQTNVSVDVDLEVEDESHPIVLYPNSSDNSFLQASHSESILSLEERSNDFELFYNAKREKKLIILKVLH